MKLFVDTHLLLLAACEPDQLSKAAMRMLGDPANDLWFSAISIREIATRIARGDPGLDMDAGTFRASLLANGYAEMPVDGLHFLSISQASQSNAYAQILISQAATEGMVLVTTDRDIARLSPSARYIGQ